MKHLGILPILLLLGVGITSGPVAAELTASQSVPSVASVGETVQVTVMVSYQGANVAQVIVTPGLPPGVVTDLPGGQSAQLSPGSTAPIRYPIRAVQSGSYTIISQIAYSEDGTWRELLLEAPFTAAGDITPPPQGQFSGLQGSDMNAGAVGGLPNGGMPNGGLPNGGLPIDGMPNGGMPNGGLPNGIMPSGENREHHGMPDGGMDNGVMPGGDAPVGEAPSGEGSQLDDNSSGQA